MEWAGLPLGRSAFWHLHRWAARTTRHRHTLHREAACFTCARFACLRANRLAALLPCAMPLLPALCPAPRTYSKLSRLMLARWRAQGIRCSNYIE